MKNFTPLFIIILLSLNAGAQIINRFTWENNPVTAAVTGPTAISASGYAVSAAGGANGSKGLTPGTGNNDINLILDGSYFNTPALDISVDFRREESQASFFYRGSYFNFGMNGGSLSVSFQVTRGESSATVNSGNIYAIPDDHSFIPIVLITTTIPASPKYGQTVLLCTPTMELPVCRSTGRAPETSPLEKIWTLPAEMYPCWII